VERISLRDEAALTWYFLHGERQFQRSTHGAMVERLIRDSMGSARCSVCCGVGILEDEGAVRRHRQHGTTEKRMGWAVVERRKAVDCGAAYRDGGVVLCEERVEQWHTVGVGSECQRCRGTGWVARRRPARECEYCARRRSERELPDGSTTVEVEPLQQWRDRRRMCSECGGTGRAAVTVASTCEEQESGGVEVSGDVLRNYARVNRRLMHLGKGRVVLELYYGPHGQSWADQSGGRMLALQAHTEAGRRLLRRTKRKGDEATEASPEERLAAQIALQEQSPEPWRRQLLDRAHEEAERAYRQAVEEWIGTDAQPTTDNAVAELMDAIDATAESYEAWLDRNQDCWGDGTEVGT